MLRWFIQLVITCQVLFLIPGSSFAGGKEKAGRLRIEIVPMFGNDALQLTEKNYVTKAGDTVTIDMFRFYLSNIGLGSAFAANAHLIDAENPETLTFEMDVPDGAYNTLNFVVGVDSIANTSGANSGDLDPVKGMYWAWNTGYIMAKIEGRSKVCKTLHNAFEFHIGGYMPPNNAARTVKLALPRTYSVQPGGITVIKLKADVAAWFEGVELSRLNSIVIPGKEAMLMADRYSKMFTVQ